MENEKKSCWYVSESRKEQWCRWQPANLKQDVNKSRYRFTRFTKIHGNSVKRKLSMM